MENPDRKPSRRDVLGGSLSPPTPTDSAVQPVVEFGPLFHFSANAMGCQFQVLCTAEGRQTLASAVTDGFELINHLEQQLSIYQDTSELSQVNCHAFQSPVNVETRLFDLLQLAQTISEVTDGAFDITATPLTRLWKIHRVERSLPPIHEVESVLGQVGYQHLILDRNAESAGFANEHLVIDLGGIGKGYALDRLQHHLLSAGCEDFLIHGGQSSVIGCGGRTDRSGSSKHPWQVSISHPLTPGRRLATLTIADKAIGTSGSGRKHFVVDGKRYGHIIDPRTGWPADQLLSVTVIADQAVLADALATAIFAAGPGPAQQICDHFGVSAVLISNSGEILAPINLAEEDIQLD